MHRLDEEHLTALQVALKHRASSAAELADLLSCSREQAVAYLSVFSETGFLSHRDGKVVYFRPDVSASMLAVESVTGFGTSLRQLTVQVESVLGGLPRLLAAWEDGRQSGQALDVDVFEGAGAVAQLWGLKLQPQAPKRWDICVPDASRLAEALPESLAVLDAGVDLESLRIRLITSSEHEVSDELLQELSERLGDALQMRIYPNPPSFLWAAGDELVAMPLTGEAAWPDAIMAVRCSQVGGLAAFMFDRLWSESTLLDGSSVGQQPWDPILTLMNRGMTMEAASRALRIAPRTGRRRVADAMKHYGVQSHFSLGAAWKNDQNNS